MITIVVEVEVEASRQVQETVKDPAIVEVPQVDLLVEVTQMIAKVIEDILILVERILINI